MQASILKPGRTAPSTKPVHATTTRPALPEVKQETYTAGLPATGYARLPVVAACTGLAKSTVWSWCAQGRFPKPVKLSPRVSAWPVASIRDWLADPAAWQAANAPTKE